MMKTEIGVIGLESKDFQQPPEARTDISTGSLSEPPDSADTLLFVF